MNGIDRDGTADRLEEHGVALIRAADEDCWTAYDAAIAAAENADQEFPAGLQLTHCLHTHSGGPVEVGSGSPFQE